MRRFALTTVILSLIMVPMVGSDLLVPDSFALSKPRRRRPPPPPPPTQDFEKNTITLSTYYPTPYGAYDKIRLVPRDPLSEPCDAGMLYYDKNDSTIKICTGGTFENAYSSLNSIWMEDPGDPLIIYPSDDTNRDLIQVGIGTEDPLFKLHLKENGSILAEGTLGSGSTVDATGSTLLWYARKGAFRAGYASSNEWLDSAIGQYSFAANYSTRATGTASVALGNLSFASGNGATAVGETTGASGSSSFAGGQSTDADGSNSIAFGLISDAKSNSSVALGHYSCAGTGGFGCSAANPFAIAIGYRVEASGQGSITIGTGSDIGSGAHSIASGEGAIAIGYTNQANGDYSLSVGALMSANGLESVAIGGTAVGVSGDYGVSVGWGSAGGIKSIILGGSGLASGDDSIIIGGSASPVSGHNSVHVGARNFRQSTSGQDSVNIGGNNIWGDNAVSIHGSPKADNSITIGSYNEDLSTDGAEVDTLGTSGIAMGYRTFTNGINALAMGNQNVAAGNDSIALGDTITVNGENSIGICLDNVVCAVRPDLDNANVLSVIGGKMAFASTDTFTPSSAMEVEGSFHTTGTLQVSSSRELKENISEIDLNKAAAALDQLEPVTFRYKTDPQNDLRIGFIAEDVPDLVANEDRKTLDRMKIIAVLSKIIQDNQALIEKQQDELNSLKAKINGM